MACASSNLSNPGPLLQLILRIPTMLWSIQAGLGIPDAVGLFSPPDLPFCQLVEFALLTFAHGMRILIHPSFKCNWRNGKRPGPVERSRYLLFSACITVVIWIEVIGVSLLSYAPWLRNDIDMLMLYLSVSIFRVSRVFVRQLNQSPTSRLVWPDDQAHSVPRTAPYPQLTIKLAHLFLFPPTRQIFYHHGASL